MTQDAPPPPPSAYEPAPPPPAATVPPAPERPTVVTAAGITLIVLSAFTLLIGLIMLIGVGLFAGAAGAIPDADMPGVGGLVGAFAGAVFVFMLIVVGFGVLQLLSGIKVLAGRNWARITGIVVAAISALFSLGGLGGGEDASPIFSLVLLAANGFIIWALATSGPWFAARQVAR
jgi:hypothetical protein